MQAGGASQKGVIPEIYFPNEENGGPVTSCTVVVLLDADHLMVLSAGQWKYLYN